MSKSSSIDETIARLVAMRGQPATPAIRAELANALSNKSNLVIAKAAKLIAEFRFADLAAEMTAAFDRVIVSTAADKGCFAKTELAVALDALDCSAEPVFVAGLHHFQPEPIWGGQSDTAGGLRAACAIALVRCNYRDILLELADLLMDPDAQARVGAARAIAHHEREEGAALLRVKLLAGDKEPGVMGECLTALLKLSPRKSLEFAAKFLDDPDPSIQDAAAISIGETRQKEALELLRQKFTREHDPDSRRSLLLAIAMVRSPESLEFLLSVVATGKIESAIQSIEALRLYRHDDIIKYKLKNLLQTRSEKSLQTAFDKTFS